MCVCVCVCTCIHTYIHACIQPHIQCHTCIHIVYTCRYDSLLRFPHRTLGRDSARSPGSGSGRSYRRLSSGSVPGRVVWLKRDGDMVIIMYSINLRILSCMIGDRRVHDMIVEYLRPVSIWFMYD